MDADAVIAGVVDELRRVPGVAAIVLGGSRARGTHTPRSDADLGLYYEPGRLDLDALRAAGVRGDDAHRADVLTGAGEWGPWINGGGWLAAGGLPVDVLYRDLTRVRAVVDECLAGRITSHYQPGHPLGFASSIYLAEVALCRVLWDPNGTLADLKARTSPYPPALKAAILAGRWEAGFALANARKAIPRRDVTYVAGCCFRAAGVLAQTLFALNEQHWMNEKGAVALAATFPLAPARFAARVDAAFSWLKPDETALVEAVAMLAPLVEETEALVRGTA